MMARELTAEVLAAANALADEEHDITNADRRKVVFCYIEEIELVLPKTNEAEFLRTLSACVEDRFEGWLLSSVDRELANQDDAEREGRSFPFDLGNVLPWWTKAKELAAAPS
jgi:hypothetical protein